MKAKHQSKPRRVSLDGISKLPQTVIQSILCLLPIREAVRTSILSREWRYKWTKVPKLVFLDLDFTSTADLELDQLLESEITSEEIILKEYVERCCKLSCAVMQQILLLHQGPLHEFSLSMYASGSCIELDQIILHLSRRDTVKKFSIELANGSIYKLPFSVFSLHHLTDLHLTSVSLNHEPIFSGFGSLRTLYLKSVTISSQALLHLLSNCPTLKKLSLLTEQQNISIIELLKSFPAIEHLTTWRHVFWGLVLDPVPREPPTSLIHLKCLCFQKVCFRHGRGYPFLAMLIKCTPNLEKIKLEIESGTCHCPDETCLVKLEEYSDVWSDHLNELEIEEFSNLKPEMEFVKFILARSPKLKKVRLTSMVHKGEEFRMLTNLLQAPRASPVQITVEREYID